MPIDIAVGVEIPKVGANGHVRIQVTFMPSCNMKHFWYLILWLRSDDDKKEFSVDFFFFYHLFPQKLCIITEDT